MPIDNIAQVSGAQMKAAASRPTGAGARQELPSSGQPVPPVSPIPAVAEVKEAVSRLNVYVQTLRRDLQFRVDESTDRVVVTVVDTETKEVIRQIPTEEALSVARTLEQMAGVLLDTKA